MTRYVVYHNRARHAVCRTLRTAMDTARRLRVLGYRLVWVELEPEHFTLRQKYNGF